MEVALLYHVIHKYVQSVFKFLEILGKEKNWKNN